MMQRSSFCSNLAALTFGMHCVCKSMCHALNIHSPEQHHPELPELSGHASKVEFSHMQCHGHAHALKCEGISLCCSCQTAA